MIAVPTTASDLQRVIKMIGDEDWSGMDVDIKRPIYEGLLEKTASSSHRIVNSISIQFSESRMVRAAI